MTITPDHIALLRAPFTPQAVKFRLDAKEPRNGKVRCVVYIDASLAADRLSLVDPGFSSRYHTLGTPGENMPVECTIKLLGVERANAGQYAQAKADDKHMKSAYSDAFKRAAVEFHVGAYLRSMPQFTVTEGGVWKTGAGKLGGINQQGMSQLRAQYQAAVNDMHLVARFGQPIDHGDVIIIAPDPETEAMAEAADAEPLTLAQMAVLSAIAGKCGYPFNAEDKVAEDYETYVASFIAYATGKANAIEAGDAPDIEAAALDVDVAKVHELLGLEAVAEVAEVVA